MASGLGQDLDDAVLAATSNLIGANVLTQRIKISFACRNLPNLDTFSRTDGMVVFYERKGNMWAMLGHTEVIMDNLSPEWVTDFTVVYKFEEVQNFKAVVYDVEDTQNLRNFSAHDFVGEIEFTLHELVTAKDQIMVRPISKSKKDATIEIMSEEVKSQSSYEQVIMIPKVTFDDNSNYNQWLFFLIYKNQSGNNQRPVWKPVYKSEIKTHSNQRNVSEFTFN